MTFSINENSMIIKKLNTTSNLKVFYFIFEGELNDEDFTNFKEIFKQCLNNINNFCVVFDLKKVKSIKPYLVVEQAQFMNSIESQIKKKLIASCVLIDNKIIKQILNSLFVIKKPIRPNVVVSELQDGLEFIKDCAFLDFKKIIK